jgi:hypothetical protein
MTDTAALIHEGRFLGGSEWKKWWSTGRAQRTLVALADALEAVTAERETLRLQVEQLQGQLPPCDGGCNYNSGPEETCSAHGRPVAEVWEIVESITANRDEWASRMMELATITAERDQLSRLHEVATERTVQLAAVNRLAKDVATGLSADANTYKTGRLLWDILASAPGDVLREHDAKIAAEVIEAAKQANVFDFKPSWGSNPHDQEILAFGTFLLDAARAAALRVGANPTEEGDHG